MRAKAKPSPRRSTKRRPASAIAWFAVMTRRVSSELGLLCFPVAVAVPRPHIKGCPRGPVPLKFFKQPLKQQPPSRCPPSPTSFRSPRPPFSWSQAPTLPPTATSASWSKVMPSARASSHLATASARGSASRTIRSTRATPFLNRASMVRAFGLPLCRASPDEGGRQSTRAPAARRTRLPQLSPA